MPTTPTPPELMTVHEVAQRLRVSYGTVYALLRDGELPAVKIGSQWRVHPERLEAYLGQDEDRRVSE